MIAYTEWNGWDRVAIVWAALTIPLVAIKLWVLLGIGFYTGWQFAGDAVAAVALCGLLVLFARWRPLRASSWVLAWLLYAVALVVEIAEAFSYYFQAGSFNSRFFVSAQLGNLKTGLHAFPGLLVTAFAVLIILLVIAGWLLARQGRLHARDDFLHAVFRGCTLVALACVALAVPSAGHRLVAAAANMTRRLRRVRQAGRSMHW